MAETVTVHRHTLHVCLHNLSTDSAPAAGSTSSEQFHRIVYRPHVRRFQSLDVCVGIQQISSAVRGVEWRGSGQLNKFLPSSLAALGAPDVLLSVPTSPRRPLGLVQQPRQEPVVVRPEAVVGRKVVQLSDDHINQDLQCMYIHRPDAFVYAWTRQEKEQHRFSNRRTRRSAPPRPGRGGERGRASSKRKVQCAVLSLTSDMGRQPHSMTWHDTA